MSISELLHPARIACRQPTTSKKRCLEDISQLLADSLPVFTAGEIFDSLIGRERLGSTGLGQGVALPHGRMKGLERPIGAFLTLAEAIDYDAIDGKPVDLIFALLVPDESTDEHLAILARLAEMFGKPENCAKLRNCEDGDQCFTLITTWDSEQQLSA